MFTGTIPKEAMLAIQDIMGKVSEKEVYCACSGNFNIDKTMSAMGFTVHSNDVSLYSKLIADIVMGEDTTTMECVDARFSEIFDTWEDDRLKKLCEVMYVMRAAKVLPQKNLYQQEMLEVFLQKEQAQKYYDRTREKLRKGALDFKIQSFYYGDFVDFLKAKKGKGVGLAFPPTYKGGYEKMYEIVDETFQYEHADYNIFDPKTADGEYFEMLRSDKSIIITDRKYESLSDWLHGKIRLKDGKHPLYLYTSVSERSFYIEKAETPQKSRYKVLPIDYEFTENTKITLKLVPTMDVNYFKGFYMATTVNYTNCGDIGLIFFADGKAFGFVSFLSIRATLLQIDSLTDFVVNSHTKKLSKLLIMLMLSRDVRMALARERLEYYRFIKTPVYTNKPVSMKYRGVFKLAKREEGKLTYIGEFGNESITEIYKKWLKKQKK